MSRIMERREGGERVRFEYGDGTHEATVIAWYTTYEGVRRLTAASDDGRVFSLSAARVEVLS